MYLRMHVLYVYVSGHVPPIFLGVSQQEATRPLAPFAVGTSTLSPQLHGLLSAVGVLICGLQDPRDERRVEYGHE